MTLFRYPAANMGALQRSVTSLLCKVATSLIKGPSLSAMEKENAHVLKGELFQQGLEEDDSYLSDAEKSLLHDFIEVSHEHVLVILRSILLIFILLFYYLIFILFCFIFLCILMDRGLMIRLRKDICLLVGCVAILGEILVKYCHCNKQKMP